MQANAATFQNTTGGTAILFYQVGHMQGQNISIPNTATSAPITGAMLTIDAQTPARNISFDLNGQLPNLNCVAAQSAYRLAIVQGGTPIHPTFSLSIRDNTGTQVGSVPGTVY